MPFLGRNFLAVGKTGETEQKIATVIGIFHQIPAASAKFIDKLIPLILNTERLLNIEPSCPYRSPLIKFLLKHPDDTLELLLSDKSIVDMQYNRFTIYILKCSDGELFRKKMQEKNSRLTHLILNGITDPTATTEQRHEAKHQTILIIYTMTEFDNQWLALQSDIIAALRRIWAENLYDNTQGLPVVNDTWHLVAKILQLYFTHHTDDIDLLFQLLRAPCLRFIPDFQFLRDFLQETVCSYTVDWKRKAFFHSVDNFHSHVWSQDLKAKILTTVLIPCFVVSFEKGEGNKLVGAPPAPYQEDDNNVVSVFINKIIDPEKPFANEDAVRIALLQFACLLVERASPHIHDGDANNKREGNKLRRLMTFAWPCLLAKNCVDPAARYHGHLLLSHIIARLAIHKRIVLQVTYIFSLLFF